MVESAADRAEYLTDFGEAFTVDPGGSAAALTAIFNNAYDEALDVEGKRLSLLTLEADATTAGVDHGVTIRRDSDSADYTVRNLQPDGQGFLLVYVSAQ